MIDIGVVHVNYKTQAYRFMHAWISMIQYFLALTVTKVASSLL